ncbi:MAG: PqqD family protein [Bacteroidaceae bacterium]|nr:PqqD family protein [Bacteroidaceae bacterium]
MELKKGFVLREICGERVIVAEGLDVINFNRLLSLNDTAAFLWKEASRMGTFTEEDLAEALCREYEIDADTARNDVHSIVQEWQRLMLV